jgi:hypothetical protein
MVRVRVCDMMVSLHRGHTTTSTGCAQLRVSLQTTVQANAFMNLSSPHTAKFGKSGYELPKKTARSGSAQAIYIFGITLG